MLTGAQLHEVAKKQITDKVLNEALKDQYFRDFIRIFLLMNISTAASREPHNFGHALTITDFQTGKPCPCEIEVKITAVGKDFPKIKL